jgi:hypothetical protein
MSEKTEVSSKADVTKLEQLVDYVMHLSQERQEWKTTELMHRIEREIIRTVKEKHNVEGSVYVAYFHLGALLPNKCSRERIRSTILGIRDWLRN